MSSNNEYQQQFDVVSHNAGPPLVISWSISSILSSTQFDISIPEPIPILIISWIFAFLMTLIVLYSSFSNTIGLIKQKEKIGKVTTYKTKEGNRCETNSGAIQGIVILGHFMLIVVNFTIGESSILYFVLLLLSAIFLFTIIELWNKTIQSEFEYFSDEYSLLIKIDLPDFLKPKI